jgi:LEA14-like dessication related protein
MTHVQVTEITLKMLFDEPAKFGQSQAGCVDVHIMNAMKQVSGHLGQCFRRWNDINTEYLGSRIDKEKISRQRLLSTAHIYNPASFYATTGDLR